MTITESRATINETSKQAKKKRNARHNRDKISLIIKIKLADTIGYAPHRMQTTTRGKCKVQKLK